MKTWKDFERAACEDPFFKATWRMIVHDSVCREDAFLQLAFALKAARDEQMANNLHHLERCKGMAAL